MICITDERLAEILRDAGKQLKYMRIKAGFTQKTYAEQAGCSETTYQRIEAGRRNGMKSPSFPDLVEAFYAFGGTDQDAAILFGKHPPQEIMDGHSAAYDDSEAHVRRLKQYISETKASRDFTFYFASSDYEETRDLRRLHVSLTGIEHNSYVAGDAKLNDLTYDCKLVSPPDGDYTFMYFACAQNLVDRALFILPYRQERKFYLGLGVMISISNEKPRCPMVQKSVVIRDTMAIEDLSQWLKIKPMADDYVMRFPRLEEQDEQFVRSMRKKK